MTAKKVCPANPQTHQDRAGPLVLVLRTSKRFLLIRWPSHDLGFAKHSPKSKLLIKTGINSLLFLNSVTNDKFIAFPKFTNMAVI